ncbi:uncharacterized protein [Nicotiana tomentosiformis]|uniref:uncharacterized protein n=1 Tax=Nicotiana tomentosiformis TaxID=4098 RepID=UPI00388CD5A9
MTISDYAVRFSDLFRHAPAFVATVREGVRRFIERLNPGIRFSMAPELEMDITYQQVVEITWRLEGMWAREREEREVKRPRDSGAYSGDGALGEARHGMGYVSRPVHSALPASNGIPATPRPQVPNKVVSFLKAQRMVGKVCDAYLAYVRDVSVDTPTVQSVSIVRDYPDVFPVDLSGMPPDMDIDFGIHLLSGTQLISIPPYRMAPAELKKLKE